MPLQTNEMVLKGKPISRGIAIGKPFFLDRDEFNICEYSVAVHEIEREINRFRAALSRSKQDIKRLQKQLEAESALEGIFILDAQLEMLQDPVLTIDIENNIRKENKNVEFIFQKALLKFKKNFEALGDEFFTERYKDLMDISRRIFNYLHESGHFSLSHVPHHSIVCAQELTASDTAEATAISVGAFITEHGGVTSHATIVAKAKGIPYITNVDLNALKSFADQTIIVDGRKGKIFINPREETIKKYESLKQQMQNQTRNLELNTQWPAETFDGFSIKLSANLDMAHDVDLVRNLGGSGVGLFRSEYIFLPKKEIPSEEEQFRIYSSIVEKMGNMPVVIRTFDLGGDKAALYYSFANDRSPFLGTRATRFLLKEQDLFKTQIRAILRANTKGTVSILFPMISTLPELLEAKRLVYECQDELGIKDRIRIGCMIEVPSAALIADYFAMECDFLSIGTNDLIQYSLAIDRSDQTLCELYEPTEPSVIRLIKLIVDEANQKSIPVTVCGEIASDPRFTSLLLGLGVQELSVTPRCLPLIKNSIRNSSIVDSVILAEKALSLTTSQEVLQLISLEYQRNVPHDLFYNM
ncbi:MAG: phosphoenolpyruvate--protein phosphotransferase [Parachlamydiaceae bacterium]|nr:phosphoenolpyruvate--protein phosphotransferase [Parachlamydiaceae bacterium]